MTEYTPNTGGIRSVYADARYGYHDVTYADGLKEFDRWQAAHDQGIRDACRPAEMKAKALIELAFGSAYRVRSGVTIPAGTPLFYRDPRDDGSIICKPNGFFAAKTQHNSGSPEYRTLSPLPSVIPDDCKHVWATFTTFNGDESREIWTRIGPDEWVCNAADSDNASSDTTESLIDPKPVPEEER